jgi:hypothetical protein
VKARKQHGVKSRTRRNGWETGVEAGGHTLEPMRQIQNFSINFQFAKILSNRPQLLPTSIHDRIHSGGRLYD